MSSTGLAEACCKIGRNAVKYGLADLDYDLRLRREQDSESLRDLASFVNGQILEAVIEKSGVEVIGEPISIYDILTSDEVAIERKVAVTDQLSKKGIDVEELRDDFVSYQSVRHHFQNCLDISTARRGVETVDEAQGVIDWSKERHENTVHRMIARLQRQDLVTLSKPRITSSTTVSCDECGEIFRVEEFLDRNGCCCSSEPVEHT